MDFDRYTRFSSRYDTRDQVYQPAEVLTSILPPEGARRFTIPNMDLFEQYPGKMKAIMKLLFREFEEGMEFLALEDNEKTG